MYSVNIFCLLCALCMVTFSFRMASSACQNNQFECKSGTCIASTGRCDNTFDCYNIDPSDLSDEENCTSTDGCPEGGHRCQDGVCYNPTVSCPIMLSSTFESLSEMSTPPSVLSPSLSGISPSFQISYMVTTYGKSIEDTSSRTLQQTTNGDLSISTSEYHISSSTPFNTYVSTLVPTSLSMMSSDSGGVSSASFPSTYTGVSSASFPSPDTGISSESFPSTNTGVSLASFPLTDTSVSSASFPSTYTGESSASFLSTDTGISSASFTSTYTVVSSASFSLTDTGISSASFPSTYTGVSSAYFPSTYTGITSALFPSTDTVVSSASFRLTDTGVSIASLPSTDTNTNPLSSVTELLTPSTSFPQINTYSSSADIKGISSTGSSPVQAITSVEVSASSVDLNSVVETFIATPGTYSSVLMITSEITSSMDTTTPTTTMGINIVNEQSMLSDVIVSLALAGVLLVFTVVGSAFVIKYAKNKLNQQNPDDFKDELCSSEKYELNSIDFSFKRQWHFPDPDDPF